MGGRLHFNVIPPEPSCPCCDSRPLCRIAAAPPRARNNDLVGSELWYFHRCCCSPSGKSWSFVSVSVRRFSIQLARLEQMFYQVLNVFAVGESIRTVRAFVTICSCTSGTLAPKKGWLTLLVSIPWHPWSTQSSWDFSDYEIAVCEWCGKLAALSSATILGALRVLCK